MNPGYTMLQKDIQSTHSSQSQTKKNHAKCFLDQLAEFYAEPGYGETLQSVKFLPFDTLAEVYKEYRVKTNKDDCPMSPADTLMAGKETFRQAYLEARNQLRLRTSKGAFETCSVCNAFHEILKSEASEWSKDKIDLVQKFKRLHLKLQSEERQDSERRKELARTSYDNDGKYSLLIMFVYILIIF